MQSLSKIYDKVTNGLSTVNAGFSIFYYDDDGSKQDLMQKFHLAKFNVSSSVEYSEITMEGGLNLTENAIVKQPEIRITLITREAADILNTLTGYRTLLNNAQNISNNLFGTKFYTDKSQVEAFELMENLRKNATRLYIKTPFMLYDNIRIKQLASNEVTAENVMKWWEFDIECTQIQTFEVQSTKIRKIVKPVVTKTSQASKPKAMLEKAKSNATTSTELQRLQSVPTDFTLDPSKTVLVQSQPVGTPTLPNFL